MNRLGTAELYEIAGGAPVALARGRHPRDAPNLVVLRPLLKKKPALDPFRMRDSLR
jgi:hypothetical protein